jgi:hypothetical protein
MKSVAADGLILIQRKPDVVNSIPIKFRSNKAR